MDGVRFSGWGARHALYYLLEKDLKTRYRQTLLGVSWVILQPLISMTVFYVFFKSVGYLPSASIDYPFFCYASLLLWTLFSKSVLGASYSLVSSGDLISKVYFKRSFIPLAVVLSFLIDFAIGILLLHLWGVFKGHALFPHSPMLLVFTVLMISLLAYGLGMVTSALQVFFKDVGYALQYFVQAVLYLSPVLYSLETTPKEYQKWLLLNPLTVLFETYRTALWGGEFYGGYVLYAVIVVFLVLFLSHLWFHKVEGILADY